MKARVLAGALAVAIALMAVTALVPGAEARPDKTYTLQPTEQRLNKFREVVNWGLDTTVTQRQPHINHADEEVLNVSARLGAHQYVLIHFDPYEAAYEDQQVPPNSTVNEAFLTLYYTPRTQQSAKLQDLSLVEVLRPWDEETVIWNDTKAENFFGDEVARSVGTESLSNSNARVFNITEYMRSALNPSRASPIYGFAITYTSTCEDNNPLENPCAQWFYSSNDVDEEGEPRRRNQCNGACVPKLTLEMDLNGPEAFEFEYKNAFRNATSNMWVVAPDWPLNYTFKARDVHGDLRHVYLNLTHPNGTLVWSEDIYTPETSKPNRNDTRRRIPNSYHVWRNASLDAPPGEYVLNVSAVDSDGNYFNTSGRVEPTVRVEAVKPRMFNLILTPGAFAQGEQVTLGANATDDNGVRRVWATVRLPTGENVTTADFRRDNVDAYGRGTWRLQQAFTIPGEYTLWFNAQDLPGNVNTSAPRTFTVEDTAAPALASSRIVGAPRTTANHAWQEIGGNLTFATRVYDNNPLDPTVTLHIRSPVGTEQTFEATRTHAARSGDTWETRWQVEVPLSSASAFPPASNYAFFFHVEDADGNEPASPQEGRFTVEPASGPVVSHRAPDPWGNRTPVVAATVEDLNLDPASVEVRLGVNGGPLERVRFDTSGGAGRVTVSVPEGNYFHGDNVTVRVTAVDTLGRPMEEEWTFAVDGFDPRSTLAFQGDHRAAVTRHEATPATRLEFAAEDAHSGVARVEYRLTHMASGAASDWVAAGEADAINTNGAYQGSGVYALEYRAVDAVGNVEGARTVTVLVDGDAPAIGYARDGREVRLTVTDAGAGLKAVRAYYRNGTNPFVQVPARLTGAISDGGAYRLDLPFTPRDVRAAVKVEAEDHLGNVRVLDSQGGEPLEWVEPNHAPELHVTNPQEGSALRGNATVAWVVEDADGDDVEVRIEARPVVVDAWRTVATVSGATSHYRWDTSATPDGEYALRVVAGDGQAATTREVTVEVANTPLGVAGLDLPRGRLELGREVTLSVTLYRPVKTVTANVFVEDDGRRRLVDEVRLYDDGSHGDGGAGDGVFANQYTPKERGAYAVGLNVLYGDNTRLDEDQVSAFTVQQSLTSVVRSNWLWFALGGLALVAIAGAVVVQLMRYGYL